MEGDPFAVIEAMTVAAFATGCAHGWLYLRGEYPRCRAALEAAIAARPPSRVPRRRRHGRRLRLRHHDRPRRRGLHLRRGDGDLQLDRGVPGRAAQQAAVPGRGRAVRPADGGQQRGDDGQRAADPARRWRGVRRSGTEGSTGTKLFCLSGAVERPGVYEVEFGVDAGRADRAGRWSARRFRAAGDPARRRRRHVRRARRPRPAADDGGGAGERAPRSAPAWCWCSTTPSTSSTSLLRIAAFFRDESCGQCVPCRVGTVRQEEAVRPPGRRAGGDRRSGRLQRPRPRSCATPASAASGQTAPNAIQSAIERFGTVHMTASDGDADDRRRDGHRRRRARRSCRPAAGRAPRSRRCATATRSRRRTPVACAWWRSRGRGCSSRRAPAAVEPGMVVRTDTERARGTAGGWCWSCSGRRSTCR